MIFFFKHFVPFISFWCYYIECIIVRDLYKKHSLIWVVIGVENWVISHWFAKIAGIFRVILDLTRTSACLQIFNFVL